MMEGGRMGEGQGRRPGRATANADASRLRVPWPWYGQTCVGGTQQLRVQGSGRWCSGRRVWMGSCPGRGERGGNGCFARESDCYVVQPLLQNRSRKCEATHVPSLTTQCHSLVGWCPPRPASHLLWLRLWCVFPDKPLALTSCLRVWFWGDPARML